MIELTKDYIENLKSIIEAKDDAKAQEVLHELYPADIAELYQELNLQEAIYLYLLMDGDKAADVLMELDEEDRHKLLKELPNELIAKRFVDNMETDDAVDLMRELDEDTQEEILSHIEDVEQAGDIVDLLKYDEDTAGGLMGTEMIVVNENWSMPKCIDEMRKQAEEMSEIYYVYVSRSMTLWMRYASNTSVITSWHPVSRKTWKPRIMYSPKPPPAYLGC